MCNELVACAYIVKLEIVDSFEATIKTAIMKEKQEKATIPFIDRRRRRRQKGKTLLAPPSNVDDVSARVTLAASAVVYRLDT